ncbi:hypothetical protein C8R44DRAFT_745598 [Mycena epipterygia]|nr:hypothetical protein C8R44DRAFT_745598 [Mycena epipterygia]
MMPSGGGAANPDRRARSKRQYRVEAQICSAFPRLFKAFCRAKRAQTLFSLNLHHSWCLVAISGVWSSDWRPTPLPLNHILTTTTTTTFGARRHLWCFKRRKMVRPSALRRRLTLAEISRIPNYATQREVAIKHARYKGDWRGGGGLYLTGRLKRQILQQVHAGQLPESAIDDAMEVKVGHTRNLPRWRKQYNKCRHASYCTIWSVFYPARFRMKAERLVHLALRAKGAHPIIYACPGVKCRKRHREFYPLKAAGGWSAVEDEAVSALKATGQKDIERIELENDLV